MKSTLPEGQYTLTNGYAVVLPLRVHLKPVPVYPSSLLVSFAHPNQNTHSDYAIQFLNACIMNDCIAFVQWPQLSPSDHTAISGILFLTANSFVLVKPDDHLFIAGFETRCFRNFSSMLAIILNGRILLYSTCYYLLFLSAWPEVNKNDGYIQDNFFKLYDSRHKPGVRQYRYGSRLRTVQACLFA